VEGTTNVVGYALIALLGVLAIGALSLATRLVRQPAAGGPGRTGRPRTGAVRWLQIGILAVAGVLLLERFVFALLMLT
jgi:hypothetical protein